MSEIATPRVPDATGRRLMTPAATLRALGRLSLAAVSTSNALASWVPGRAEFADGLRLWADVVDPDETGDTR